MIDTAHSTGPGQVVIVDHPLALDRLSRMRDVSTDVPTFRRLCREIGALLAVEATRDLPLTEQAVQTPLMTMNAPRLQGLSPCIAPVLRAGLGLADGMLDVLPDAVLAHVGLARDHETLQPAQYYLNAPPDLSDRLTIVADPMLATGGSAIAAIRELRAAGAKRVRFAGLLAAPEGVAALRAAEPAVDIFVTAIDARLNDVGYILPGLGDAGDRQFGT